MTIRNISVAWRASLLALLLVSYAPGLRGAESNTLRLAIGPFFAPAGNDSLRQASQVLPELLTADLSHTPRFQLVEREKIHTVWGELNLNASGLIARDTVAKLGRMLACDWLVSGSFVQAGGRTYVWTKVIDVRSGVVLDLNASPYEPGVFTNTVAGIAAFLSKAGSQPKGRQFIAMGPFKDMNPPLAVKREDWSRRLPALIEKHFLEAGFGVVEIAAVGPIFEEQRLEAAGLTGQPEGRVKLQAAFWLVDGGCEWIENAPGKLGVGLRIQKVGGPAQIFRLTEAAGAETEQAVIATITRASSNTNLLGQPTPNAEADLLTARGMELATASTPFEPKGSRNETQWDSYKQLSEQRKQTPDNRNTLIATYERAHLRDPKNLEAKGMLGRLLLAESEPARREHGKEMLREVFASYKLDAKVAELRLAEMEDSARRYTESSANPPRRPDDWLSLNQAFAENPEDMEAKCDLGAALLKMLGASSREQGRKMLAEVAAGDRQDQAERARRLLAEPEKSPAIPDRPQAPAVSVPAVVLKPETNADRERREFLQKQFAKFVPVRFQIDGPQLAKLQRLSVKENMFDYHGRHYCGFRFTTPKWLDGDLKWMLILAKTETQKNFISENFEWYIIPTSGRMKGFENFSGFEVASYPQLKQRFPYTVNGFSQSLSKNYLEPGKEYAIWFGFEESDLPDIAFALTIQSHGGYTSFGILPLQ